MLFKKWFFFFFLPCVVYALPGYELPWGGDSDIHTPIPSAPPVKESPAVFLAKKVILFHQKVLSPVDGPRSHFYPCSSQYMKLAMTKHGFWQGFFMGCDRLLREGEDPWVYRKVVIGGKLIKFDPPR